MLGCDVPIAEVDLPSPSRDIASLGVTRLEVGTAFGRCGCGERVGSIAWVLYSVADDQS
jgi:hypothetical protein